MGSVKRFFHKSVFRPSIHGKVIHFGTNRKLVCDFLLVRRSNIGHILHRFGDITDFLCSSVTPPLFHPNFMGVPVAPDRPCWGQPEHEPISREIIFEVFHPVIMVYLNVTDRQTDGRMDRMTDIQTDRRHTVAQPRSAYSVAR